MTDKPKAVTMQEIVDAFNEFIISYSSMLGKIEDNWRAGDYGSEIPHLAASEVEPTQDLRVIEHIVNATTTQVIQSCENNPMLMLGRMLAPNQDVSDAIVAKVGVVLGWMVGLLWNTDDVENLRGLVLEFLTSDAGDAGATQGAIMATELMRQRIEQLAKVADDEVVDKLLKKLGASDDPDN